MIRTFSLAITAAVLLSLASGCASSKPAQTAVPVESARVYDRAEYTSPEEREIYVSSPQETHARKDTENDISPSLVTQRKAKLLLPEGH
jgi:hypothetical protein